MNKIEMVIGVAVLFSAGMVGGAVLASRGYNVLHRALRTIADMEGLPDTGINAHQMRMVAINALREIL
jgi:hypothetical protein